MTDMPVLYGLYLAITLFCIGFAGLMLRRNILFMLMSLELMLNAAALAFISAGALWGNPDGQVMFIMILTLAAAEVGLALALLIQLQKRHGPMDMDQLKELRG